jgi:serine/threonine protein kinase
MRCPSCQADNEPNRDICFSCGRALAFLPAGHLLAERYLIEATLGKGGMGMVYKALDRILEEPVAIKVLRPDLAADGDMARRFRSEIKLARRVSHRNVCRIHEYGEQGGLRFISMEWVDGNDLRDELKSHPGGLPLEQAFDTALQLADGLDAIHEVGIIHRDLKTQNVMIDARGLVRLMDFGIARSVDRAESSGVTLAGQVMGTPEYMSPEQAEGRKLDVRTDIYSLGVVWFELFTGRVPFKGNTTVETLLKHLRDPPPLEGPESTRIPRAVVPVLRKALAKRSDERYASAAEMRAALNNARGAVAPSSRTLSTRPMTAAPAEDRRRHSRLDIHVNLVLKHLSRGGSVLQEERTIADNISRGGARVLTSMSSLEAGEVVLLEEVDGDFTTRAEVRSRRLGKGNICRLHVKFLDREAPDRLAGDR